jgi:hypothetical protein
MDEFRRQIELKQLDGYEAVQIGLVGAKDGT